MTIAELQEKPDAEIIDLFRGMPEPSYTKAINTEPVGLDQIIDDFSKCKISQKDREALQNDLVDLL
jgi:hypothetical protein